MSTITWASQVVLVVKNLPAKAGDIRDMGSIPESGRSPGGGHGNPLQYSCLENSMDRGAWWAPSIGLQRAGPDTHTITLWGDTINKIDESKAILGGMVVWDRVSWLVSSPLIFIGSFQGNSSKTLEYNLVHLEYHRIKRHFRYYSFIHC